MKQGSGLKRMHALFGMMGAMFGQTTQNQTKENIKEKGKQSVTYFNQSNPIYIPTRSQKVKSKILAKRNAKR